MEEGVCMYNKYGFCKFRDTCKRKHYEEHCEDSSGCCGPKMCQKRHPRPCKRYNTEKGCKFGGVCAYQHKIESINGPENDLEKKVKLLETLMIEMTKKMSKLESEVEDLKSMNSHIKSTDPSVKKGEEIFDKTHNDNKPAQNVKEHGDSVKKDEDVKEKMDQNDHSVKDNGKPIVANNEEEVVNESEKETSKPLKPKFKCDLCGATFKKDITLKKHVNTKHDDQNCKVCHEVFKTSMEVLKHVAKEHSSNIKANISVKDKEQLSEQDEEDISECEDNIDKLSQFKCFKCRNIVSLNDKFNGDLKKDQMCKLCTMFAAYGD